MLVQSVNFTQFQESVCKIFILLFLYKIKLFALICSTYNFTKTILKLIPFFQLSNQKVKGFDRLMLEDSVNIST